MQEFKFFIVWSPEHEGVGSSRQRCGLHTIKNCLNSIDGPRVSWSLVLVFAPGAGSQEEGKGRFWVGRGADWGQGIGQSGLKRW